MRHLVALAAPCTPAPVNQSGSRGRGFRVCPSLSLWGGRRPLSPCPALAQGGAKAAVGPVRSCLFISRRGGTHENEISV